MVSIVLLNAPTATDFDPTLAVDIQPPSPTPATHQVLRDYSAMTNDYPRPAGFGWFPASTDYSCYLQRLRPSTHPRLPLLSCFRTLSCPPSNALLIFVPSLQPPGKINWRETRQVGATGKKRREGGELGWKGTAVPVTGTEGAGD